jgi:hypothetical protein
MDIVPILAWLREQGMPIAAIGGAVFVWYLIRNQYALKIEKLEVGPRKK